ncbi:hypothetical protein OUZ56_006955 [Daphnia magna]|uniref:Uncharacterized protein n=1 Tax=Daphnia magna TaxID=35525 RepID=A0ABQ9YX75_9CRUS|nr:hypothetical protein OUZ56_006955 [Daphnia magna]
MDARGARMGARRQRPSYSLIGYLYHHIFHLNKNQTRNDKVSDGTLRHPQGKISAINLLNSPQKTKFAFSKLSPSTPRLEGYPSVLKRMYGRVNLRTKDEGVTLIIRTIKFADS